MHAFGVRVLSLIHIFIRINASQISVLSRLTQGVRLMRVSEGNRVVAIAVVEPDEETPEGETAETVEE